MLDCLTICTRYWLSSQTLVPLFFFFLFLAAILEADGPEELGFEWGVLLSTFGTTALTSLSLSSEST